jgi:hypothetical protein
MVLVEKFAEIIKFPSFPVPFGMPHQERQSCKYNAMEASPVEKQKLLNMKKT